MRAEFAHQQAQRHLAQVREAVGVRVGERVEADRLVTHAALAVGGGGTAIAEATLGGLVRAETGRAREREEQHRGEPEGHERGLARVLGVAMTDGCRCGRWARR